MSVRALPSEASGPSEAERSAILNEIRSRGEQFETAGHVPDDIVDKLKRLGAYRAFVPRALGGDELSPSDFCRLIELISQYDASTGWVASFGMAPTYLCSLPPASFRSLYERSPDVVFAGAAWPSFVARSAPGGVVVSGRWKYGSGCMGASIIGVGIRFEDSPLPRMAILPQEKVRIDPDWDVMGLRATGSHDLVVEDVFVPTEWTFVRGGNPAFDLPIYRYPSSALAGQVLAIVGLGAARASLKILTEMATEEVSLTGAPPLAKRVYVHRAIAEAEAILRSARAWFYEATDEAFAAVQSRDTLPIEQKTLVRLAATNAAQAGAEVTRRAFSLSGMTGTKIGHPLLRNMNDAAVVAQHGFLGEGTWHCAGAILLGQPAQPGYP